PCEAIEFTVRGLLSRPKALGICELRFRVFRHIRRDNGCFTNGHDFLRSMAPQYSRGLVMFDRHGCGQENRPREELEKIVADRLSEAGWGSRATAIVLDPELETWIWSDSPHVDRCLGWQGKKPNLRKWLEENGWWSCGILKPERPKEAALSAVRHVGKTLSRATYYDLAKSVSLKRCADPAFQRFREILRNWFPEESSNPAS
ncbi:MAG: hypothetical protein ABIH23_35740, partial [bacterium]